VGELADGGGLWGLAHTFWRDHREEVRWLSKQ
jgi:hypothetical protein